MLASNPPSLKTPFIICIIQIATTPYMFMNKQIKICIFQPKLLFSMMNSYETKGNMSFEPGNMNLTEFQDQICIFAKNLYEWQKCIIVVKKIVVDGIMQTCHFDVTQNLNECEKKSEYTAKQIWIWLLKQHFYIEISTKFTAQKIWI